MSSHHETLQKSFPGPRLAGVAFIVAPLAMLVAALALMRFEGAEFEEIQQRIAAEPLRAEIGLNVFVLGWMLTIVCVAALARLIAQRRPLLAAFGGFLAIMGLTVSLVFGGIASFEHGVAKLDDRALAAEVNTLVGPPAILFALLPGVPLGWALLAVGSWRAGVISPLRAPFVAGPALVPVGAIAGFPVALPIAFAALAIALVPLGVELLRAPSPARRAAAAEPAAPQG